MALVLADRVRETTTTIGTGTVTLGGAVTGYQGFSVIGNGNTTYYCIAGQGTAEWEVGIGTYTASGTTLARTTVLASSNAGALVNFSTGIKDVFVTYPSEKSVNLDAAGLLSAPSGLGTNVPAFLATPTSANLAAAVTDETGSGSLVFATSPTLTTPNLGTPSAVNLTNATALPLATAVSGTLGVANGGTGLTSLATSRIPYGNGTGAYSSSAALTYNGTIFKVGATAALVGATNPITAFTGSANQYVQTYILNALNGGSSSADFVAYPNNGADTAGWVDMGITSSGYSDATFSVTGPNESYLFGSAPAGSGTTGNLVYATDSTGTANSHQWYVGGFNQAKGSWKMQLSSTNLQIAHNTVVSLSSSSDALRITQTGTGNALVVEDSTNPDSTPFVVDANGAVGVGTTTPAAALNVVGASTIQVDTTNSAQLLGTTYTASTSGNRVVMRKSRSATINTNTIVQSGDEIGSVIFRGADGTNYIDAASITTAVDGTPGTNDMPGRLVFSTTADGASTPTERMRITSSGAVGIAGTPSGTYELEVSGKSAGEELYATNGLVLNSMTISTSTTIPSGYSASSVGPIAVANGVTVTIANGSRWVTL